MIVARPDRTARRAVDARVVALIADVSEQELRRTVEVVAVPRHFHAESPTNRRVGQWIGDELASLGYDVHFQGPYRNVVALPHGFGQDRVALVGAHYDSVPQTPGADDNASGVAALLECARLLAVHRSDTPVCFVAFNAEEDGLIGSTDFVESFLPGSGIRVKVAHVLEMIGFRSREEGSQAVPAGLPVRIPAIGDFLGVLGNRDSNAEVDRILEIAPAVVPDLEVVGLKVSLGAEHVLPVLARSDHAPFWQARIPAVMWTDTSEFRNPHYHRPEDGPSTLDYGFLADVTRVLLACLLDRR